MEPGQDRLPTMEIEKNPELTELAKKYKSAQLERLAKGRVEKTLKDEVLAKMHELGLTTYEDVDDEVEVSIEQDEKLKVNVGKDTAAGGNGKA